MLLSGGANLIKNSHNLHHPEGSHLSSNILERFHRWPFVMLVAVLQELFVYHQLDCSSIIDIWDFL
jgi:hypothetical protein